MITAPPPVSPQPPPELDPADRAAALGLLRDPALLDRIVEDLTRLGVEGEDGDILLAYLALTSRLLPRPVPILLDSSGGPSAVTPLLGLLPEGAGHYFSEITERALFRAGSAFQHRVLALGEEAVARAKPALKLLLRDGDISLAAAARGRAKADRGVERHHTEGPIALLLCAGEEIDAELAERCLVLRLRGEEGAPTRGASWRELESRQEDSELVARQAIRRKHRALQQLLEPLSIPKAFEPALDPPAPWGPVGRHYRPTVHALELLRAARRGGDSARWDDRAAAGAAARETNVQIAHRLLRGVGRRAIRELPPATRDFLDQLRAVVAELAAAQRIRRSELQFTRRQIRELTGLRNTRVHEHLNCLVDLECVLQVGRRGRTLVYQLAELGPELQVGEPGSELASGSEARDSIQSGPPGGSNSAICVSNSGYVRPLPTPNSGLRAPNSAYLQPPKSHPNSADGEDFSETRGLEARKR